MKIGDPAPDFELESSTGEKLRLASYFGKKKIILFFTSRITHPVVLLS